MRIQWSGCGFPISSGAVSAGSSAVTGVLLVPPVDPLTSGRSRARRRPPWRSSCRHRGGARSHKNHYVNFWSTVAVFSASFTFSERFFVSSTMVPYCSTL